MNDMTAKKRVVILTDNYRVIGDIEIMPGARLTDYLAESRDFFAVTDAEVWDLNGRQISVAGFMNIHRQHVQIAFPEEQVLKGLGKARG